MTINGKTPSEVAGINIECNNKWLTLMRKSIQYQKRNLGEQHLYTSED